MRELSDHQAVASAEPLQPVEYFESPATLKIDRAAWESRLRALDRVFQRFPAIAHRSISVEATQRTRHYVDNARRRLQLVQREHSIVIFAKSEHGVESFTLRFEPDRVPTD